MTRLLVYTRTFDVQWNSIGLVAADQIELEKELLSNPSKGSVIPGTLGLRKLRFKVPGKGKRGGIRILYIDFPEFSKLFLISLIKKNEKENLSGNDIKQINRIIKEIRKNLNLKK